MDINKYIFLYCFCLLMFYFLFFRRVRLSRAIAEGLLCRCCRLRANWSFTPLTIKPPGTIVIFSGPKEHVNSHVRASYVAVFIAVLFYSVQYIECKCSIFIFYRWDNVWRCGQLLAFFCFRGFCTTIAKIQYPLYSIRTFSSKSYLTPRF